MEPSWTETPLVYPCYPVPDGQRYVVRDVEGTVSPTTSRDKARRSHFYSGSEQLLGSASISEIAGQLTVTTCALPVDPSILSLTLTHNEQIQDRIELDLGHTSIFGLHEVPTVKVQCFSESLVLVDARGIVLVVQHGIEDNTRLRPHSCTVISIPDLLSDAYVGAEVSSSMVVFPSSDQSLVAMSPFLVSVDLQQGVIELWSQTETLKDMKARSGGIFAKASDLLLGRTDGYFGGDGDDMPPISALCLASNQDTASFVFTLHSDSTLRRWRLDANASTPTEVCFVPLPSDRALPPASQWSETYSAVALTARVYASSVCALAIYIKTASDEDYNTLTVLSTSVDYQIEDSDSTRSLDIPDGMASLVGMEFSSSSRCSLTALMKTKGDDDVAFVYYPPSYLSLVSNDPTAMRSTLDGIAKAERDRIRKLAFPISPANEFDEEMHRMDMFYLQQLFRPTYPRGCGTVTPPLSETVLMALEKVVPNPHRRESIDEGCSVELETLLAIQDWRRKEHQQGSTPIRRRTDENTAALTPTSIYDSYVIRMDEGDTDMGYLDEQEVEAQAIEDESKILQLEQHEKRWKKLLTTVCDEEQQDRAPLEWTGHTIVRAAVTTSLAETTESEQGKTVWDMFDEASLCMLKVVQQDEALSNSLLVMEAKLSGAISRATLALALAPETAALRDELTNVGSWAAQQESVDVTSLHDSLMETSESDIVVWLEDGIQSLVYHNLPGVTTLSLAHPRRVERTSWPSAMADSQTRHAACALFVQSSDSIRELRLGRCMLLSSLQTSHQLGSVAFRCYLHTLSVLWACTQVVPLPTTGLRHSEPNKSPSPRPAKRLSFGDDTVSILRAASKSNVTTALDVRMICLSQEMEHSPKPADLAREAFRSTYLFERNIHHATGAPADLLLELGVLPPPLDSSVVSDYPRLALRLMSIFLAFQSAEDSPHTCHARKEAIAECLLIEANSVSQDGPLSTSESDLLRARACNLLVADGEICSVDNELLQHVYTSLRSKSDSDASVPPLDESMDALPTFLHQLLRSGDDAPGPDIFRLSAQPTARLMFYPLIPSWPQVDTVTRTAVLALAQIFLRISDLMHRLSILERHTEFRGAGISSSGGSFLLSCTEGTISEFAQLLPASVYLSMDEYASLWSFLFRHACSSQDWIKANHACVNHPSPVQKVTSYSMLVTAMVDAGSLDELLGLCSSVTSSGEGEDDCVDVYEIVAETLAQVNGGDFFSSQSMRRQMEYLGYLYSLHASKGHWKRAAQAMEVRHDCLEAVFADLDLGAVDETAILNGLILASLAVSNAVALIMNPSNRFLVSGEVGPYPLLPFLNPPAGENTNRMNKRERVDWSQPTLTPFKPVQQSSRKTELGSRLSRFVTCVDLEYRASQEMTRKILCLDSRRDTPADFESDLLSQLISLGYFEQAVRLAKATNIARRPLTGNSAPDGRDHLLDFISFLLRFHVIPLTANSGAVSDSMDIEGATVSRPTLLQLLSATDSVTGKVCYSSVPIWNSATRLPDCAKTAAAGSLTRSLTMSQVVFAPSLAVEVAECFLDVSSSLPNWLENLLLGAGAESGCLAGLFARAPKRGTRSYSGDPSALFAMYMKRAMYDRACELVSMVMLGLHRHADEASGRESVAASRLPETGDLDFVPYGKIDALWDVIETLLMDGTVTEHEKLKLKVSRRCMKVAIEKHFELLKISEMGMQSARALTA